MAATRVRPEPPLVVIVGPTASGKTGLAIALAKEFDGEIISADSRAVYRGLDIGTAKPSMGERQGVVHWGFDLVDPGERFTVVDFQHYAAAKIADIRARGKVPFLVGGTGLYIDSVIYNYDFPEGTGDNKKRKMLENLSLSALYIQCKQNNIDLPENYKNKRYVINTILRKGHGLKRRVAPIDNIIIVGITTENNILRSKINARAEQIFSNEMMNEARDAAEKFGWDNEAMTGNIYPLLHAYFEGQTTLDQAIERFRILDWQLAKRQITWFKRSKDIRWLRLDEAYTYIAQLLASMSK